MVLWLRATPHSPFRIHIWKVKRFARLTSQSPISIAPSIFTPLSWGRQLREEGQPGVVFGLLPHDDNTSGCPTLTEDNRPSLAGPLIYLSVDGRLNQAVAAVTQHGGSVQVPPHPMGTYGYRAVIVDSEGNRIALHSSTA